MTIAAATQFMARAADLEIIVPALNEQDRIFETLLALVEQLSVMPLAAEVRVIDNGSCDRTADLVDRVSQLHRGVVVTVEGCSQRGKGAAVARGMLTSSARAVGFCDADLATPAQAIEDAVRHLDEGWPIVIGSRRVAGATLVEQEPVLRRAGGVAFRIMTRPIAGGIRDTQCGLKFFRGDVARRLFADLQVGGFAFDLEILARARLLGIPVKEMPVEWTSRRGSTFRPVAHGAEVGRDLWRLRQAWRASLHASLSV